MTKREGLVSHTRDENGDSCLGLTDGEDKADRETQEHELVATARTKELLRAEGTPEHGGGEEGVLTGARHGKLGVRRAHVLKAHLVVEDTRAHKRRDDSGDHLRRKRVLGRDLDVVRELEVVGKVDGLCRDNVAVHLREG